ncbi:SPFH domain-containing protein [Heyndrickxia sporothermodurans]|uniref:SPFH domain-containing protein n=2 Tax=Heyndrickxia sporothermodurans TaxID=46224 RepID=A0AB37HC46_9BACI|nr:SPFH domain-containing protein [Heyndrickxia sporothermodurans]MBL5768370.1 SPFH domain-containing protein [Heyndrickxia sporothermodurans]MBL5772354.1 SPFH domain-containing protein [Heyndrickxia sporothermodurans]MBL5775902.1 SPFH domain-containing protein [Heyndrickxia sporothermodurans]MBL5779427.1 SPFH domain-containing protein [Heyndrickxia sporothermodurans]MBL5783009.1 SPFH domain-containing protein [Heyndrickxia sporothermodurans]
MSIFRNQFANVVEWEEFRDDMIFYKWRNREIKKGSRLIIRPGQDAIFLNNGRIEGVFQDDGEYDIESQIIPFLSTLKGFKFGFNSGMRVEVLFINTKEFNVKWGTKNAINIPAPGLPGGIPIRANGTFNFKVNDYIALIDKIAGVKEQYLVEDVRTRITSILDQLFMKWIAREGKDMFNLQANSFEISKGIQEDLDMQLIDIGLSITGFNVMSFNYPKEIQDMITKNASFGMVGNVDRYQQISMIDGMASGKMSGSGTASDMAGMMMGMNVANQMMNQMNQNQPNQAPSQPQAQADGQKKPNFCPNCGTKTGEANFCPNCGQKLI